MPVYFAYRSAYAGPSGKHVVRFEDDTVLGWFQRHWTRLTSAPDAGKELVRLLGVDVYGFHTLFEHEPTPPAVEGAVASADANGAKVTMPAKAGRYRLFVIVRDGRGGAATANVPLLATDKP